VTGCPALTPVHTSSEKRIDVTARGRGSYFDYRHLNVIRKKDVHG